MSESDARVREVPPGAWDTATHFYPRVPNAQLHPLVRYFLAMSNAQIAMRYCHLHPEARPDAVTGALSARTQYLRWAGADLFLTTTDNGMRRMVVVETNSSPSGQKSMPLQHDDQEQGGYRRLLEQSFVPMLARRGLPSGVLAVLWDKNFMEASGYAAVLADLTGETVLLCEINDGDPDPLLREDDGVLLVRHQGEWTPIRACLRYVTQRPWNRIPVLCRTVVYNPVVACLAGGRNKLLAAKAYDLMDAELDGTGLSVRTPDTVPDVSREEVPLWVRRMGGVAVVKVPYANAGQGVYTITSEAELQAFMDSDHRYDRYIVQALVGNIGWSSRIRDRRLYHIGTVPNPKGELYVSDLRFMVGVSPDGFFPVSLYARRARTPLVDTIEPGTSSWDMLGTNLSVKGDDGRWSTEPDRLMLMDSRDFSRLGIGIDDLIEAYLQTVLATTAIDRMAQALVTQKGRFRRRFFEGINPDPALCAEILP